MACFPFMCGILQETFVQYQVAILNLKFRDCYKILNNLILIANEVSFIPHLLLVKSFKNKMPSKQ